MVSISELSKHEGQTVTLGAWVFNQRASKGLVFTILRDGSGMCQCITAEAVVSAEVWEMVSSLTQESSLYVTGNVLKDERSLSGYEIHISDIKIIQIAENYPITPKEHGVEFLQNNRHLWLRSKRQWAIMRIRNEIVFAIHRFFQERNFMQLDAPIFTGNAAEGTSTLFETKYFDQPAYLTQSGQLYAEAMALAHGKVYTFGPTFRAEKSKTRRHLTEFWMVEPEMAFYDLNMNMELAEAMLCFIVDSVLRNKSEELEILGRDKAKLEAIKPPFPRVSYSDAIELLKSEKTKEMVREMLSSRQEELKALTQEEKDLNAEFNNAKKGRKFQIEARRKVILARLAEVEEDLRNIPVWKESVDNLKWGDDLGGSDETLLTMQFDKPILVHRYPAEAKAFYMKRDPENNEVVLCVDILAPEGYGEIIGGSQREDSLEILQNAIKKHDLNEEAFSWYLDLRRYGSVPHSGFGLGIERTVSWICGLHHVRETIPFARTIGRLNP
ncbi:MAG: asparagine--tRNA ligase [Bacteroidetes bacterium]|nr:asparagine--tRNA ligase [Bacteroidota bacterium]NCQ10706.1 asparagine--tRNA ligase [Bacteroidota bacterium]